MSAVSRLQKAGEGVRAICDRFWLFTIAAISLIVIGIIAGSVIWWGMPENAGELLAATSTGLMLIVQKVIEAQGQRRLTDQLAQSAPAPDPVGALTLKADERG
jgi:hypothetical protein